MPETNVLLALSAIALLAGIGISAIGPGGIFLTIALYALLAAPPPVIAGTASATFVAAGILGTISYLRSGELAQSANRNLAWWLSGTSIVGALCGTALNPLLSKSLFGILLGTAAIAIGALIVIQRVRGLESSATLHPGTVRGKMMISVLGFGIGVACAVLGLGGPVLAVPALVVAGVPMLTAVAVAQIQSIFVSTFATAGYALQNAVSWPLALVVGIPQLVGVVLGWRVAQRVRPERLEVVMGGVLVFIGGYLILQS